MSESQLEIAVVGAGVAGLSAAWLLSKRHKITLIERESRLGGHSNTVDAPGVGGAVPVDTGFIVYNLATYPNLVALFRHLDVPTAPTLMGFSVSLDSGAYEYSGNDLAALFGQPANLLRPSHYAMIRDLLRFYREAPRILGDGERGQLTLGEYLAADGYSPAFVERHILPMAAAIWSTPSARVLDFPAASFVRFYESHGLLQLRNRPAWRTVAGGSRQYVKRLLADFDGKIITGAGNVQIKRPPTGGVAVALPALGVERHFDACVVAAHADDALSSLLDADAHEQALLGSFRYSSNRAVLHTDAAQMPRRRRVWSSWNYLGTGSGLQRNLSVTYWMNALQPLGTAQDYFVTLNPIAPIARTHVIADFDYQHPQFDATALSAQRRLWSLQGRRNTWFCGSYFGYGFHEDALQSGLAVAEMLGGVRRPWSVEGESNRLDLGVGRWPSVGPVSLESAA
jgi:predicted NAD/FAD-binding protein